MKFEKLFLIENNCYKTNAKIDVKGIMIHSTGVNNPYLKRYVGPNDGKLGINKYNNHWNQPKPDGRQVCVHAFIGKLDNEEAAVYQTLPWNLRGWHCGGKANNTHIGIEICEDNKNNEDYFLKAYEKAVELTAYLCKQFNLNPLEDGVIIAHYEGYIRGLASNHGDPVGWFIKFNKTMNKFRQEVAEKLNDMLKEN